MSHPKLAQPDHDVHELIRDRWSPRAFDAARPVPRAEFAAGGTPDSICARSIRELAESGVRHFYVSNLPVNRAARTLERILSLV